VIVASSASVNEFDSCARSEADGTENFFKHDFDVVGVLDVRSDLFVCPFAIWLGILTLRSLQDMRGMMCSTVAARMGSLGLLHDTVVMPRSSAGRGCIKTCSGLLE